MARQPIFVGIDVGKDWLDVAHHTSEEVRRFHNNEAGILELVAHLKPFRPHLVVLVSRHPTRR
jgi:transposase